MSTAAWSFEPSTGRYYYDWDDGQGKIVRQYNDEAHPEPPTSNEAPSSNTQGGRSSRRNSASGRDRRGSEYPERGDPIPIYSESSSQYQSTTEHPQSPSGSAYPYHNASPSYHAPRPSWVGSHPDDSGLAARMDTLTVEGSGSAYTFSSSMTQPGPSGFSGTYQDKGKGIATANEPANRLYSVVTPAEGEKSELILDKSYKVRSHDYKKWFRVGRVFSTLWTDPLPSARYPYDSQFMSTVSVVHYGERVYSTIRRFVVVKFIPENRACTCLPVTTYDGRGIEKRGIRLSDHGQIYSGSRAPNPITGLEKEPLRVKLASGARELDRRCYINYGRPYTVQTNVKVKDVGELDSDSRRLLRKYYNEVNFANDEDDYSDPGPPRTAQDRTAILTGTGGAVADTSSSYVGPSPSAFGSLGPSIGSSSAHHSSSYFGHGSGYTGGNEYVPPTQSSYVQSSGYASHPVAPPPVPYFNTPVYDMGHPSSPSGQQTRDNHFVDNTSRPTDRTAEPRSSSDPNYSAQQYSQATEPTFTSPRSRDQNYCPPVSSSSDQYSSTPVASSSSYPVASSSSARQDTTYVEEVVVLPTLEEARASTSRRFSTSQYGGSGRSTPRDRDRDRERERDRRPFYDEEDDSRDAQRRRRKR